MTFFNRLKELEDPLDKWFEDIQYVKDFFNSIKKDIFNNGLVTLEKYEDMKGYVQTEEVETVMEQLTTTIHDPIPYSEIKDIPELIHIFEEEVKRVLEVKKANAMEQVTLDFDEASLQAKQYGVSTETQQRVEQFYKNMLGNIESYTDIYKVDAAVTQSQSYKMRMMQEIQREIKAWQRKKELAQKQAKGGAVADPIVEKPVVQKKQLKQLS